MPWNYRLLKRAYHSEADETIKGYSVEIIEHYIDSETGESMGYIPAHLPIWDDSMDDLTNIDKMQTELIEWCELYKDAFKKPILDEKSI